MKKRQLKKNKRLPKSKLKSLITVDGTNVTPNSEICVFVSNKFKYLEGEDGNFIGTMFNDSKINIKKVTNKGYDHIVHIKDFGNKPLSIFITLSDNEKTYYIIRNSRLS